MEVAAAVHRAAAVAELRTSSDWSARWKGVLPIPPRNVRRGKEVLQMLHECPTIVRSSGIVQQEAVIRMAAYAAGTWRRRGMVSSELDLVTRWWPDLTQAEAMVRWATVGMSVRGPSTMRTLWNTALALWPQVKTAREVREWGRGHSTLYGAKAWYPRGPVLTEEEVRRIVYGSSSPWLRVKADVMWSCFARDADLSELTKADFVQSGDSEWQVSFPFLKNDMSGEQGVIKVICVMRPLALQSYLMSMEDPLAAVFPQGYERTLVEMRAVLGAEYGTRAFRRGAAITATRAGATRRQIKRALAHRRTAQQRVYTGILNDEEVAEMRAVQMRLRAPTQRASRRWSTSMRTSTGGTTMNAPGPQRRSETAPSNVEEQPVPEVSESFWRAAMQAALPTMEADDGDRG